MRFIRQAVWLLLLTGGAAAAANGERIVPAPTWQYQFPSGALGHNAHLSGDDRDRETWSVA